MNEGVIKFMRSILIKLVSKCFFRKDFVIYREPNVSPSQVTENNFPEKVRTLQSVKDLNERTT
jgi:hypothetical protein